MSDLYLTNVPCVGKLGIADGASFQWDGKEELILSNKGVANSILQFKPGDGVRAYLEGSRIRARRLQVPNSLSGVTLWACHVEKDARLKSTEIYHRKLKLFKSRHPILYPEPDFSPTWKTYNRVSIKICQGPYLFTINEEKLLIARYAKYKGTRWATVAAYCDPDITKEEAKELIRKHGIIEAPRWYIANAIHEASHKDAE